MYFSPRGIADAVERFAKALVPGGVLFLGHSETLHGISNAFETIHINGTFCYARRASIGPPSPPHPHPRAGVERPRAAAETAGTTSWVDAIDRASRRVDALARSAKGPRATLERATALFREERFQEALAVLDRTPDACACSTEIQLLRATILTNQGCLAAAEETCRGILSLDPRNPSARYLLAICRAQSGDLAQAVELHRRAIEADPAFAMSHLQIGLLARRRGDLAAARASLRAALKLLEQEDTPTLTLLCGGFSRRAVIEMCRAELDVCGDAR
jgi:chemotaxis protein methyltransferase CheR